MGIRIDLTKVITFKQIQTIKNFFMTQLPTPEQIEGNVLIALATGWKFNAIGDDLYPEGYYSRGEDEDWAAAEELSYHNDFNWLVDAYAQLGFEIVPVDIEPAWLQLVEVVKAK